MSKDISVILGSNKLDKVSSTGSVRVYGVNAQGNQTMYNVNLDSSPYSIVRRDTYGRIHVGSGQSADEAVNFKQLDTKLDKVSLKGETRLYAVHESGSQTTIICGIQPTPWTIPLRDGDGCTNVGDGKSGTQAVNFSQLDKKYDKSGGTIDGAVTITGKTKVQTAPKEDDEVIRKGDLSSPNMFKTLFGNQNIVGQGNIDLFKHSIKGVLGNSTFYLRIYSSNNLQANSLTDLKTLLGDAFEESVTGSNGIMAITNEKVLYEDGTDASIAGYTITDKVKTI